MEGLEWDEEYDGETKSIAMKCIQWFEGVRTCKETDSLFSVLEAIVKAEVSTSK